MTIIKFNVINSFLFVCLLCCCGSIGSPVPTRPQQAAMQQVADIPLPTGFKRVTTKPGSFAQWLLSFPLADENTVYYYNGQPKPDQTGRYAVLDIDVGTRDLQQCADAAMRLWGEYLYEQERYNDIHFNFVSGDEARFDRYAEGYRCSVSGSTVSWSKTAAADNSYAAFRNYMDLVFSYAGTASLFYELETVSSIDELQIGDIIIQTGNPYGHAVTVVDMATNGDGEKVFLLAQSYMPAQSMHILVNPNNGKLSPWYHEDDFTTQKLITPDWTFHNHKLGRF